LIFWAYITKHYYFTFNKFLHDFFYPCFSSKPTPQKTFLVVWFWHFKCANYLGLLVKTLMWKTSFTSDSLLAILKNYYLLLFQNSLFLLTSYKIQLVL
jgi:hypothetical protein